MFIEVNLGFAQKIQNGTYTKKDNSNEFYETFTFTNKSCFEHKKGGSIEQTFHGKGHYYITNDSLTFVYDSLIPHPISYSIKKTYANSSPTIDVKFKIFCLDSSSLVLNQVNIFEKVNPRKYNAITNKNGEGLIQLLKTDSLYNFTASSLGFTPYNFTIDGSYNYIIKVFLSPLNPIPTYNEKKIYFLKELNNNSFTLISEEQENKFEKK
ncbi:hypothetical protein NBRC110019_32550 [Neptunitalea chrysea]|uniref:Uncharacterized protein n=1 Tax=Neptunitalea chrysea TaxID=1647581 RepID=A0A9W6B7U0_9FLAO|nr:hypothetical protein [Neptunitalea chrysea]GLB54213.1 hypothetical protein NBRC110019_32550 [Neptunitalea chrysea]